MLILFSILFFDFSVGCFARSELTTLILCIHFLQPSLMFNFTNLTILKGSVDQSRETTACLKQSLFSLSGSGFILPHKIVVKYLKNAPYLTG